MYDDVTWDCIHISDVRVESEYPLSNEDIIVLHADFRDKVTKNDVLTEISRIFKFPDYFGYNWDALLDCLKDINSWMPAKGYVLVVNNADGYIRNNTIAFGTLNEIWLSAAEYYSKISISFHIIYIVKDASE